MGMDVDAVEDASRQLQRCGAELASMLSGVDTCVRSLEGQWEGADARRFIHEWWPQHKKRLLQASEAVEGLGQAAWNQAQDQRRISEGGSNGPGLRFGVEPRNPPSPGAAPIAGGPGPRPDVMPPGYVDGPTPRPDVMPPGHQETFRAWSTLAPGRPIDFDNAYGNQCVDVINDYASALFPGVPPHQTLGGGDAHNIYGNASSRYFDKIGFGTPGYLPQPGDIICIGTGGSGMSGTYGHVAVVTEVRDGVVHVLQQDGANPHLPVQPGVIGSYYDGRIQGLLRPLDPR